MVRKCYRCSICHSRLNFENAYNLKNCNHTFHQNCITRWINQGSQTCPRCQAHSTLADIKKIYFDEGGDSQESDDEMVQGTSNVATQNPVPPIQGTINVIVKDTYNDSKMAVQIEPNGTVLGLKYKISDRRGLPTATQRLIYRGRNLEDNYTLSHYNIVNNTIVDLVMRCEGGKI
uniref:RING-type domain-containing protein n=1 Tax=Meloidogyne incognita TaxID=6306 RepID=A0A914NH15_MELIC